MAAPAAGGTAGGGAGGGGAGAGGAGELLRPALLNEPPVLRAGATGDGGRTELLLLLLRGEGAGTGPPPPDAMRSNFIASVLALGDLAGSGGGGTSLAAFARLSNLAASSFALLMLLGVYIELSHGTSSCSRPVAFAFARGNMG